MSDVVVPISRAQSMELPPEEMPAREPESMPETAGAPVPLGYDRGNYFYLSQASGQIVSLTPSGHTELNLCSIASGPYYWQRSTFSHDGRVRWREAANWLMDACHKRGIFDPAIIRGRGAWDDAGRVVVHLGDRLIVDDESCDLSEIRSKFVYERAAPIAWERVEALRSHEAAKLLAVCCKLPWKSEDMGRLFVGWMVIAPICGALRWRPHFYLVGESSSGKTWVINNIVRPLLGRFALRVKSKTTEPAIRRALGTDARPVIFDEAETQNDADRSRMQMVQDLARQASAEDDAPILKAQAGGSGVDRFLIRSTFFWSSINLALDQAADESRTVVGQLEKKRSLTSQERAGAFEVLEREVAALITPDFAAALFARTVRLVPVIRHNADVLAQAAAERFGDRRQGDTLGAVLAGAHSLHNSRKLTIEEARAWIGDQRKERRWVETAVTRTETTPEHDRILAHILDHVLAVHTPAGQRYDRSVADLLALLAPGDMARPDKVGGVNSVAAEHLERLGIRVGGKPPDVTGKRTPRDVVWFARAHSGIKRLMERTDWPTSWANNLISGGAIDSQKHTVRFGAATKKAVGLPFARVFPEGTHDPPDDGIQTPLEIEDEYQ